MLSPEQRAEMVAELEQLAKLSEMAAVGENGTFHKILALKRKAAAAALTSEAALAEQVGHANAMLATVEDALTLAGVPKQDSDGNEYGYAERIAKLAKEDDEWANKCNGLAEQVRVLREALEQAKSAIWDAHYGRGLSVPYAREATSVIDKAIAFPLPQAARQAAENAERAGLLENLIQQWRTGMLSGQECMAEAATKVSMMTAAKEADRG